MTHTPSQMPDDLLLACENFFDSWFGPAFGPPEHLDRIEKRREKSKQEFSEKLRQFVNAWRTDTRAASVPSDKPVDEIAMAALDLYLEKASGHSCKQCPAPTDDELSSAIRAVVTLRAYIEQNSPATSDAAIGSGTNAVLRLQDGQESAPDRGDIIKGRTVDVEALKQECILEFDCGGMDREDEVHKAHVVSLINHLAAQGLLHSTDKIILNRADVPEGLDLALPKPCPKPQKDWDIIVQAASLLAQQGEKK